MLDDFILRLFLEYNELVLKLTKLTFFINSDNFQTLSGEDRDLLLKQQMHMEDYKDILKKRMIKLKVKL